jgi:Mg2+ and Co2+ transporter CorA
MQPGLIWGCQATGGRINLAEDFQRIGNEGFRWLHLNLADQRTHAWLSANTGFPTAVMELLTTRDTHPRVLVEEDVVGFVLLDFERDFDAEDWADVGALHIAMSNGLMVTGRYHPLRSADMVRQRLSRANPITDGNSALALLLDVMSGTFADLARELYVEVQAAEDAFLNANPQPAAKALVSVRRRTARLHRVIDGMRASLHRLERDPDASEDLREIAERFAQRVDAIDSEIASTQSYLRVLRDEFDLQVTQRTNDNLYFLSVMSALLLPATLVTGFFGMNTGGLPFAQGPAGTLAAAMIGLLSSAATWMLLRARR